MLLNDRGYLFEETSEAFYDEQAARFLPDRYVEGTCPNCGYAAGARRPVRQLRQAARPDRPDRPAQPVQRRDARVRARPTHFYIDLRKVNEPLLEWASDR